MKPREKIYEIIRGLYEDEAIASIERAQGKTPVVEQRRYDIVVELLLDIRDLLKALTPNK